MAVGGSANSLNKLKRKNQHDVLEVLRCHSPASIAEISERTGLSKVTVTKSIGHYVNKGLVVAIGKGDSTEDGGKRPTIFAFNPNHRLVFSVKVDDSHLLAALTNLNGDIVASHTAIYTHGTPLDQIFGCLKDAFTLLLQRQKMDASQCLGVVVGWQGIIDPETGVCFTTPHFSEWGRDISLKKALSDLFPKDTPIYVDNWIRFHAYGEVTSMNPPVERFFVVSSEPEGVNGALVVDGQIYRGSGSLSGEVGHIIVDTSDNAEICLCGGKGCLEAAVSPRRILAKLAEKPELLQDSPLQKKLKDGNLLFTDILDAANVNDKAAQAVVDKCVGYFAIGINNIVQICDPELIILQGEFARGGEYFKNRLLERVNATSLPGLKKHLRIEYSKLGNEGAIMGAGQYVADSFFQNTSWA